MNSTKQNSPTASPNAVNILTTLKPEKHSARPLHTNWIANQAAASSIDSSLKTRKETSRQLGVSVQTLANWAWKSYPKLPLIKVGRSVRYRQSKFDASIPPNVRSAFHTDLSGGRHV